MNDLIPSVWKPCRRVVGDSSPRMHPSLTAIIFFIAGRAMTVSTSVIMDSFDYAFLSGIRIVSMISKEEILKRRGKALSLRCGR